MPEKYGDQIVETPREARGAEPGPSMFVVLTTSTLTVAVIFAIVWLAFFKNAA
ncbi:MAG: hypothetical protein JO254_13105 [Pseudolabrys sp.]|nr:hypothetical protein [Pseudolabrys sp.]